VGDSTHVLLPWSRSGPRWAQLGALTLSMAAGLSSEGGRRELSQQTRGNHQQGWRHRAARPVLPALRPHRSSPTLCLRSTCLGRRAISSWELAEPPVPNGAGPGCWAPRGRARASSSLSTEPALCSAPAREPGSLCFGEAPVNCPPVLVPTACWPSMLPHQLGERIYWRRSLCAWGQLPCSGCCSLPGPPEPWASLLTAPPLAGQEVAFLRAAMPPGIS